MIMMNMMVQERVKLITLFDVLNAEATSGDLHEFFMCLQFLFLSDEEHVDYDCETDVYSRYSLIGFFC